MAARDRETDRDQDTARRPDAGVPAGGAPRAAVHRQGGGGAGDGAVERGRGRAGRRRGVPARPGVGRRGRVHALRFALQRGRLDRRPAAAGLDGETAGPSAGPHPQPPRAVGRRPRRPPRLPRRGGGRAVRRARRAAGRLLRSSSPPPSPATARSCSPATTAGRWCRSSARSTRPARPTRPARRTRRTRRTRHRCPRAGAPATALPPRHRPRPNSPVFPLDDAQTARFLKAGVRFPRRRPRRRDGRPRARARRPSRPTSKFVLPRHTGVLGTTGGGKSTTVAGLVHRLQQAGVATVVIDVEGEYTEIDRPTDDPAMLAALRRRGLSPAGVKDLHVLHPVGRETSREARRPGGRRRGPPVQPPVQHPVAPRRGRDPRPARAAAGAVLQVLRRHPGRPPRPAESSPPPARRKTRPCNWTTSKAATPA